MSESPKAVFLSYASQDAEAAKRIAEALRGAGIEVWLDQSELRGGDAWDQKIRKQIRQCALFVPVISANSQTRVEGYFRLEWHLAEQRSHLIARGQPFIVPVCIDDTADGDALAPDGFLAVQWIRLRDGAPTVDFVEQVKRLLAGEPRSREPGVRSKERESGGRSPGAGPLGAATSKAGAPVVADYEMVRKIGSGAYGDVWLARGVTGIFRAVKVVWRERFEDAEPFEREFRGLKEFAAISLKVEGQMALLHIGRNDAAGFFYYVMELADDAQSGRTFSAGSYVPLTLKELKHRKGRVPAEEVIRLGAELASALAALHERGLVHRDIKPSNAIIVNGKAKLADIGLVSSAHDAKTFIGTSGYVPPEGPGAPSADVYALGRVLYELATGLDRDEFPRLPPGLDRLPDRAQLLELNEVFLRACAPADRGRYRTAAELAADLVAMRAGTSLRRRQRTRRAVGAGLAMTALVAAIAAWNWRDRARATAPGGEGAGSVSARAISVAVLPFAAPPADHDGMVFAEGVHAELISTLARNPDLQVIARGSTLAASGPGRSRSEIARALEVGHLVTGGVVRAGGGFRVKLELFAANSPSARWSDTLDCTAADLLRIQPELARRIAQAVGARVEPAGSRLLAGRTLDSIAAYELLAKARKLAEIDEPNSMEIAALLEDAVRLDPESFLAWAELGSVHADIYFSGLDRTPARRDLAKAAVDAAVRLAPDAPEVLLAQGNFYYWCFQDYSRAIERYRRLLEIQPNSAKAHTFLGAIDRRQGRWADAVANLRRSVSLDPMDLRTARNLLEVLMALRRYGEAETLARRLVALFADRNYEKFGVAHIEFLATGSTREADRVLASLAEEAGRENERRHWERVWAVRRGEYAKAAAIESDHAFQQRGILDGPAGQKVDTATWLYFAGKHDEARQRVAPAKPVLRERAQREPDNLGVLIELATIAMIEGHDEEALRYARRCLEVGVGRGDTQAGPRMQVFHASVLAWTGATDAALDELGRLLKVPYGGNVHRIRREGLGWLRLHGHPRFEALLADPANNAPFELTRGQIAFVDSPVLRTTPTAPREAVMEDKSIAVMPFSSPVGDPAGGYFADGVYAEVLHNLSQIAELRVLSRASMEAYRDSRKPIELIGGELGVAYVVTGEIRRTPDRVRLTARLLRAASGEKVWEETYDRELHDIVLIQGQLAQTVAERLRVGLAPPIKARLAAKLTGSLQAYDLFLKSREGSGEQFYSARRFEEVQRQLEEAVGLDPDFVRAWAELGRTRLIRYYLGQVRTPAQLKAAREAVDQAVRLDPDSADTLSLLGTYYYQGHKDYPRALDYYLRASRLAPNVAGYHVDIGMILRRQGDWPGSTAALRRGAQLDPGSVEIRRVLLQNLLYTRQFAEAKELHRKIRELEPGNRTDGFQAALIEFRATGSTRTGEEFFASMSEEERESTAVRNMRTNWALRTGDFAEAIRLDRLTSASPGGRGQNVASVIPIALALAATGDLAGARARLGDWPAKVREQLRDDPADFRSWGGLAAIEALLGNTTEARRCMERVRELLPEASDAFWGPDTSVGLAELSAWLGDHDHAIAELKRLLRLPMATTVHEIRKGPHFFPLRGDPRFEAILADPANQAPLDGPPAGLVAAAPPVVAPPPAAAREQGSIAVLPFETRESDEESGYIADGLHEDVVTNLAGLRGLKVTARASALRYRGTKKSPPTIGRELGVTYILTGSLRRQGNQVRVTAQLVEAAGERQVWAKSFDRDTGNVLALQADLAREIVPALHLVLSPEEARALAASPTTSGSAYDLYLQARALRMEGGATGDREKISRATELAEQAVASDPTFMRAWVELSAAHLDLYFMRGPDRTAARLAAAEEAIARARQLAPDAPEVLLGQGRIRYNGYEDYAGASYYYERVLAAYPNYPGLHLPLGLLHRRLGRWADALAEFKKARREEPGSRMVTGMLMSTLLLSRRYEDGWQVHAEEARARPDDPDVQYFAHFITFRRTGSRREFEAWWAALPAEKQGVQPYVGFARDWAYQTGDAARMRDLIRVHGATLEQIRELSVLNRPEDRAELHRILDTIKPEIDRGIDRDPLFAPYWIARAWYHALRGEKPAALEALAESERVFPESKDAINGASNAADRVEVLIAIGEHDRALAEIERLLKKPGFVHVWMLRSRHCFGPLRGHPEMQRIINDPAHVQPHVSDAELAAAEAARGVTARPASLFTPPGAQ